MDTRSEIREFLTSRRARITPEQVDLASYGSRRVPGLRREEVAVLAGVSAPYYTRLERGEMSGVSESVLEALSRALRLDDAERAHLFDLARALQPSATPRRRRPAKQPIRPSVQHILDAITGAAAFVRNERLDVLAANALGHALYSEMFAAARAPANAARFIFLDRRARDFYPDWNKAANDTVAVLRASAGRDPYDRCLSDLIGELSTRATSSGHAGPRTTSANTSRASSTSTTRSSATSASPTTAWISWPIPGSRCTRTPPSPARATRKPFGSSAAGRRHSTSPPPLRPPTIRKLLRGPT